jgi:hypothetical protein
MTYFAKVVNGVVADVIVAEASFFNNFIDSSPGAWIETFKGGGIRKNFAGVGYNYHHEADVFYPPQIADGFTLNKNTWDWDAPTE